MTTRSTPASSSIGTTRSMVNGSGSCGCAPGTHGRSGRLAGHMWICESTMSRRGCAPAGWKRCVASAKPVPAVPMRNLRRVSIGILPVVFLRPPTRAPAALPPFGDLLSYHIVVSPAPSGRVRIENVAPTESLAYFMSTEPGAAASASPDAGKPTQRGTFQELMNFTRRIDPARRAHLPPGHEAIAGSAANPFALERSTDLVEDCWIVDRRRHGPRLAVGDLLDGAAQNLSRARLGQPRDRDRDLERRDRADLLAHESAALLLDLSRRPVDAGLEHDETRRHLALDRVLDPDHSAFGHVLMRGQHLLHAAGREPVTGDVDDVVGAAHHVDVAVLVLEAGIGSFVVAGELGQVALAEWGVLLAQPPQPRRRQEPVHQDRP